METWAYFYGKEKKGCFIQTSRKNHRKKIVKNQDWRHDKDAFCYFIKISHKHYKSEIVKNTFVCFNVEQ